MALIDDLVSYYKLDIDNATQVDSHGSNDGTVNGATFDATGFINSCYDFDGINDFIGLSVGITSNFTISAWFRSDTDTADNQDIFSVMKTGNSSFRIHIKKGATDLIEVDLDDDVEQKTMVGAHIAENTWYHVVLTKDGEDWVMYLNANSEDTYNSTTFDMASIDGNCEIGRFTSGVFFFAGKIDEVAIWSRGITQAEVTELYNAGAGLAYPLGSGTDTRPRMETLSPGC